MLTDWAEAELAMTAANMPIASEIVLMKLAPLFYALRPNPCYAGVRDAQLICLKRAAMERYWPTTASRREAKSRVRDTAACLTLSVGRVAHDSANCCLNASN
jgi:hypothetical protein